MLNPKGGSRVIQSATTRGPRRVGLCFNVHKYVCMHMVDGSENDTVRVIVGKKKRKRSEPKIVGKTRPPERLTRVMPKVMDFPWYISIQIYPHCCENVTLRAESYDKDEFPIQGWPTTITAFRRNPVPWYGLGWLIYREEVESFLCPAKDWWSPTNLKYVVFANGWVEYGYNKKL